MLRARVLHIEDVLARRQGGAIVAVAVRRDVRDCSMSILTQDDERIFLIGFGRTLRETFLRKLNFL